MSRLRGGGHSPAFPRFYAGSHYFRKYDQEIRYVDKDEANDIAEALLAKERKANARSWGRRVPFFLRSKDSARLGRELEWELFRQVRRNMFASRLTSVTLIVTPLVLLVLFWLFIRHPVSAWFAVAVNVAIVVPSLLVAFHVRRELGRLSRLQTGL
jgi:hypothetical protein